jgi:Fe-S oxidoreductase
MLHLCRSGHFNLPFASFAIGASLFRQIEEVAADFVATDCETCKWQIEMSTPAKVKHPISIWQKRSTWKQPVN